MRAGQARSTPKNVFERSQKLALCLLPLALLIGSLRDGGTRQKAKVKRQK
jgi:hypothetical protein